MDGEIRVASPCDMDDVAAIMNRGFLADPTVLWSASGRDFEPVHGRFVELCARPAFDVGGVHLLGDLAGAAIWYPPGVELDVAEMEPFLRQALRPDRIEPFFALLEACAEFRPAERYWELELLAVDPVHQGRGLGGKLLEHGLAISDGEGAAVYLESSNPANLDFYRRHGFELLSEVQLPGTPKRFPMLRAGRSA